MRRFTLAALAMSALVLSGLLFVGCGPAKDKGGDEDDSGTSDKGGKGPKAQLTPVEPGNAVLKGKVTLKGAKPDLAGLTKGLQDAMKKVSSEQFAVCYNDAPEPEKVQQAWRIDDNGGVENVVVWIQPAKGTYFKIDPAKKFWRDTVVLDQPHCAFTPHVDWACVYFKNPKETSKTVPSGQKFLVQNSATISHNTKYSTATDTGDLSVIPGVKPGEKPTPKEVDLKPSTQPAHFVCNIHGWMDAYVWSFDHPFAAVTKKDGSFEIKNLPAGKFKVLAWHEKGPNNGFLSETKINGDDIELTDGDNVKNFELEPGGS